MNEEALRLADALRDGTYLLSLERDATEAELRRQHAEIEQLRTKLGPLADSDHICLLCGRAEPCMTDEEAQAHGGPGAPCTFDPTPQQLWDNNKKLRAELQTYMRVANAQAAEIERLKAALHRAMVARHEETEAQATEIERLRAERDHARASVERAVRLLTGIHSLMYPAPMKLNDGRTMVFRPSTQDPHTVLQDLSDRIRALHDELADIDAAKGS